MLRIHFSPDDLARTHVATAPDPVWETVLSFQILLNGEGGLVFERWRREVRPRLAPAVEHLLRPLSPPTGDFADFLTPGAGALGLPAGLEAIRATPPERLRHDLAALDRSAARAGGLPPWTRLLARADRAALRQVTEALRRWHRIGVAPYWPQVRERVEADWAAKIRVQRRGTIEDVLAALPPPMRWQSPVLETRYPDDRDVHLDGRGLLLVPSFFCWRLPVALIDPQLPQVLVYPVAPELGWLDQSVTRPGGTDQALRALLGSTRAAVLDAISAGPATTGELADRVRVSVSSASEHATVLRDAGLVASHRVGNHVLHLLTESGAVLLDSGRPAR